jgi:hypothetical protein
LANRVGVKFWQHDAHAWPVASECLVRDEGVWHIFGSQLNWRLAECKRIGLSKEVAHEFIVVRNNLAFKVNRLLGTNDTDEFCGHYSSLMDELVEGVLSISTRLSKVHLTGLVPKTLSMNVHTFAIAFHRYLQKSSISERTQS